MTLIDVLLVDWHEFLCYTACEILSLYDIKTADLSFPSAKWQALSRD